MIGATFGKLTVVEFFAKTRSGEQYRCLCECGSESVVYASKLRTGHTKSCGCGKYGNRPSAIKPGDKFTRLTAVDLLSETKRGSRLWRFACECGAEHIASAGAVKSGIIKSCGCLRKEKQLAPRAGKHKMIRAPEYRTWTSMLRRCRYGTENPRHGGRGISVCERWNEFANFYQDMGPRPSPAHSLDRIDNDGNYEPGNCRWATPKVQANNRRNSITISVAGKEMPLIEAARELGIPYETAYWRVKRNRPITGVL